MKHKALLTITLICFGVQGVLAQNAKPEDTEYYTPVPKIVTPGKSIGDAPLDAIVLFNGKNLDEWELVEDSNAVEKWDLKNEIMTVSKTKGDLQTKRKFQNFQLHIEYRIPADIEGSGQARGNSGIFLASVPWVPAAMSCRYSIITITVHMLMGRQVAFINSPLPW